MHNVQSVRLMTTALQQKITTRAVARAPARLAPEARGKCLEGTCALLSEKTHVYDVANRPWLLPYIAERATGGDRAFLLALIRHASADDPADRPSFAELVAAIDRRVEGATVN